MVSGGAEDFAKISPGGIKFPVIEDKNKNISRMYGMITEAHSSKAFFIIDSAGLVRGRNVGDYPVGHLMEHMLIQLKSVKLAPGRDSHGGESSSAADQDKSAISCSHCKKSLANTNWSTVKCCNATFHHHHLDKWTMKGKSLMMLEKIYY